MPVIHHAPPAVHRPAPAASLSGAEQFVRQLYAGYRAGGRGEAWLAPERTFAGPVLAMIRHYRDRPEPGTLDGDPVCGCQDWEDIRVDAVTVRAWTAGGALAVVAFRDTDDVRRLVRYRLVRRGAGWRVGDMTLYGFEGEPWLSAVLRRDLAPVSQTPAGRYGAMLVAVRAGEVRGAFSESRIGAGTEEAPQFSCSFTFSGQLRGEAARVSVRTPEGAASAGRLSFRDGSARLRLRKDQPGCAATSGSMVSAPYEARREDVPDGSAWLDAGVVVARVARLRAAGPRPGSPDGLPYLMAGDAVAVLARAGQWLRVRGGAGVEGWVRADELALPASRRR